MAAPREGRGARDRRSIAFLLAAAFAPASLDALAASPESQVWGTLFLVVGAGFLACIVVELASGRGPWVGRVLVGIVLAVLDVALFLAFVQIAIAASVSDPSPSASGRWGLIVTALVPWIIPMARLWWLRRSRT